MGRQFPEPDPNDMFFLSALAHREIRLAASVPNVNGALGIRCGVVPPQAYHLFTNIARQILEQFRDTGKALVGRWKVGGFEARVDTIHLVTVQQGSAFGPEAIFILEKRDLVA